MYLFNENHPGHYWRDFEGSIPNDALKGGVDIIGQPIFIGQVLYKQMLIATKIYSNSQGYFGLYGKEHDGTKNLKVPFALTK